MFTKSHSIRLPILTFLSFGFIALSSESVRADLSPLIFPQQDNFPLPHLEDRVEEGDPLILGQSEEENSGETLPDPLNLSPINILLELVNGEREKVNAPPLQLSSQLEAAAQSHAEDMAENDFVTPVSPQGIDTAGRVTAAGYASTNVTENLGINHSQPQEILEQWLDSPGYRLSLLNPEYTEAGLGYANNPTSRFKHYWSLVLAVPGANDTAVVSPPQLILLQEEGELTDEDPILPVDGSHYDLYAFQGKAGQAISITLESTDFDTYLFLLDEEDRQLGENDDISEDNKNSSLTIVLPEDGTYRILVNSYDPNSRGRYKVSVKAIDEETEL